MTRQDQSRSGRANFMPKEQPPEHSVEFTGTPAHEFRAIRYHIARKCHGLDPDTAGQTADYETEVWLETSTTLRKAA